MPATTPEPHMRENPKWVRGVHAAHPVVDSRDVLYVWEHEYYPAWYFPITDVTGELRATGETFESETRGTGTRYDIVTTNGTVITDAAWRHLDSPIAELRDRVRIEWKAIDVWFEEDVEVFVHPRSPEVRVDVMPTSKHVRVIIEGETIADSVRTSVLYEAHLPPRYYFPQSDVRMDLLTKSATVSECPYKGFSHFWDVTVGDATHNDLAWGYRTPLPEALGIAGMVCFYNEKVAIEIDGHPVERPTTKFS